MLSVTFDHIPANQRWLPFPHRRRGSDHCTTRRVDYLDGGRLRHLKHGVIARTRKENEHRLPLHPMLKEDARGEPVIFGLGTRDLSL